MLYFNDLLAAKGIPPHDVNIILHSPKEKEFAKVLPSLLQSRPNAFEAFQASHNRPAERALKQGRPLIASFVKTDQNELVFAGMFHNKGWSDRPIEAIWQEPEINFLHRTFGLDYEQGTLDPATVFAWFKLERCDLLGDLAGRLLIEARLTQTYVRLAENLDAPVVSILHHGVFAAPAPDWRNLTASGAMVRALPPGWATSLREWRGVYLIVDEVDGARYVGSAYGTENLLGRWRAHVAGDKGITQGLQNRDPVNFRFSILQLLSPDAEPEDVIHLEHSWMDRLHTRRHGLNT